MSWYIIKSAKMCIFSIFLLTFTQTLIVVALASTPSYIGISEGDEFTWNTVYDRDPLEEYYKDLGHTEEQAKNKTDDILSTSYEEITSWKIEIKKIEEEDEYNYSGSDYNGVEYESESSKKDDDGWDEKTLDGTIMEYDVDVYIELVDVQRGLFNLIVANDVDWDELVEELNEEYDNDYVSTTATARDNGIVILYSSVDHQGDYHFESTSRYSSDGVLMYYQWTYDDETIIKLESENYWFYENWYLIALFGIIGVIAVVAIVITVLQKKKSKQGVDTVVPSVEQHEKESLDAQKSTPINPYTQSTPEVRSTRSTVGSPTLSQSRPVNPHVPAPVAVQFCHECGSKILAKQAFCSLCGARLDD